MGPQYKFTWRRWFFKRSKRVVANYFDSASGHMILTFADGSLYLIPQWIKCELWLGTDWVLARQKDMERQAGQAVPLNCEAKA